MLGYYYSINNALWQIRTSINRSTVDGVHTYVRTRGNALNWLRGRCRFVNNAGFPSPSLPRRILSPLYAITFFLVNPLLSSSPTLSPDTALSANRGDKQRQSVQQIVKDSFLLLLIVLEIYIASASFRLALDASFSKMYSSEAWHCQAASSACPFNVFIPYCISQTGPEYSSTTTDQTSRSDYIIRLDAATLIFVCLLQHLHSNPKRTRQARYLKDYRDSTWKTF